MADESILQKLPDNVLEKTIGFDQENDLYSFLTTRLPAGDINEIEEKIRKRYNFTSVRAVFKKRVKRKGCPRNPGISATKKRQLGIYSIDRKGLKFDELLPLHSCWTEYMENMLDLQHHKNLGFDGDVSSPFYEEFVQLLWKADYHGAYIKVSRSTCPAFVGKEGILIFETKNTLKLLGRDGITRTIPKVSCEFTLKIGDFNISFLGKNFMVKPPERVVKKPKVIKCYDL